jgi:hypothetical protein
MREHVSDAVLLLRQHFKRHESVQVLCRSKQRCLQICEGTTCSVVDRDAGKGVRDTDMRVFRIGQQNEKYPIPTPTAERYENNWEFKS